MRVVRQRLCAENIVRIALTRLVRWEGGEMGAGWEWRAVGEELGKGREVWGVLVGRGGINEVRSLETKLA